MAARNMDPVIRDFQSTRTRSATQPTPARTVHNSPTRHSFDIESHPRHRHTTMLSHRRSKDSMSSGSSLSIRSDDIVERRINRHDTVRNYHTTTNAPPAEHASSWEEPGAEPGIDTTKEPTSQFSSLLQECQITVVDVGKEGISKYEMDNDGLEAFLQEEKPSWCQTRWINVNGLSWDVVKMLGNKYHLHPLAVEDMLSHHARTKADWYSDQAFMIVTLQKLIRVKQELTHEEVLHSSSAQQKRKSNWKSLFSRRANTELPIANGKAETLMDVSPQSPRDTEKRLKSPRKLPKNEVYRTLQRYRGGGNFERRLYMEKNSMLTQKGLAVSVEKVAIFLTLDNTVVVFFEHSADDVEEPILRRLETPDTILRKSNDASMIVQAVIDAVVDLGIPVVAAYEDIISELEVEVLTDPSSKHSRSLYITGSELSIINANLSPIANVISALRDHQRTNDLTHRLQGTEMQTSRIDTVEISPLTISYLGDVEDHVESMSSHLESLRTTASSLIDLLYNTMSAYQNETMKILTYVTICFLPLTFLTGYFGQNFDSFPAIHGSIDYFWEIATPTMVATVSVLFAPKIWRWWQRQGMRFWVFKQKKIRSDRLKRVATIENARAPGVRFGVKPKTVKLNAQGGLGDVKTMG